MMETVVPTISKGGVDTVYVMVSTILASHMSSILPIPNAIAKTKYMILPCER